VESLITKYLAGEASSEEARELFAWIEMSPENAKVYNNYKKALDASSAHFAQQTTLPDVDIDAEWAHFRSKVERTEKDVIPLHRPKASQPVWMKLAAAVIILIVSGFAINWYLQHREVVFQSEAGTLAVSLPDGSHVMLNSHSKLTFRPDFGDKTRAVTLDGEAFFEVAHDSQKPFKVDANHTVVEVVGTSFDVQSYKSDRTVTVVVATGIVRFTAPEIQKELRLTAGLKGVFVKDDRSLHAASNEDVNFLSWNTRKLVFEDNDLKTVIEKLNRIYDAHISIATEIPPSCRITVAFDHQTLEAVLHVLETTLNLTITHTGDKIEITHAGC
jgi:transmembrane sensor